MYEPRRSPRFRPSQTVPAEALKDVAIAAERWEELVRAGLEVSFDVTPGGLRIALSDLTGEPVRALTPGEALVLAEG